MVKHIVTFTFEGDAAERHALAMSFKNALVKLPEVIDCLQSIEVGINENPAETADLVLTAVVHTMDDVAVYATHPAHVAAAALVKGHVAYRCCVDYSCDCC